jgi:hypothetical protein
MNPIYFKKKKFKLITEQEIMRIVTTDTGRKFNVRGLTRAEVKRLAADGIDLTKIDGDNAEQALDAVLEIVLTEHEQHELDGLVYHTSLEIWTAALAETYGNRDEEKN